MNLATVSIERLKDAPYNPRKPLKAGSAAYRRLARSLDEFGLVQPIVWNERSGYVVGGHQRLGILRDRGATEVEVVVVDLPPSREKALNVALNNSALASDWDLEKLTDLVGELHGDPDADATLTGFDEVDLRSLLFEPVVNVAGEVDSLPDCVRVSIDVPRGAWANLRPQIDAWLQETGLMAHVRE